MPQLGSRVRDTISGFTGILTGRAEYLYGCVHLQISPEELSEGKPIANDWFDEQRVELVDQRLAVDSDRCAVDEHVVHAGRCVGREPLAVCREVPDPAHRAGGV